MKNLLSVLIMVFAIGILDVSAQDANKETSIDEVKTGVNAYYFHATRRCETCQAVEKVSKETIKKNYAGKVTFIAINRENNKDNSLVKAHEISGQTLLIVKGDEVVDLTTFAFMNARTNPDKLESKLKSTIDSML